MHGSYRCAAVACRTDCWCTGVITFGQDGEQIAAELQSLGCSCLEAGSLQDAVAVAQDLAQQGGGPAALQNLTAHSELILQVASQSLDHVTGL